MFNARVSDIKCGNGRFCGRSCSQKSRKRDLFERLWEKVDVKAESECWEYKEYRNQDGYGVITTVGDKKILTHRVAFMSKNGIIPDGMRILHKCDNPPCCNPNHLFLGTQADNVRDMHQKGRATKVQGEKSHKAKLTNEEVLEIRATYNGGNRMGLSKKYKVHHNTIMWIVTNKSWKHLL